MIKLWIKSSFFILGFIFITNSDNLRFAIFPFSDEKPSELNEWARYAIPQLCFIKLHSLSGINVWDPVALFQIDSVAPSMDDDSLLLLHKNRWQWDVLIGGAFHIDEDTLKIKTNVIWASGKQENLKMELKFNAKVNEFDSISTALVMKVLSVIKHGITKDDSITIKKRLFTTKNAFQTYALGLGYEMHSDFNSAVTAYNRAVEIDPDFAYAWCSLSNLYDKSGRYDSALKGFQQIQNCKYKDELTIAKAADYYIDRTAPAIGLKYVDDNKNYLDKTAEGQCAMGKGYLAQGEYQRAFALLTKAVASGPSNLDIQFTLGNAYLLAGEYRKASDIFNELIKNNPYYLRYYSSLGAAYRNSGRLMESSMILEAALKIDPNNTMIMIDLSNTYFKLKWYQKARQLIQHAIDLDPQLDIAYVNLGVVCWYEGLRVDAERNFDYASKIAVTQRASLNNLANLYILEDNYRKAIKLYKKANKSGKKNAVVQYNLAEAYLKTGQLKKAIYYLNEYLRLSPERIDILLQAALLAEKVNRLSDAESYYHKILELYPYHRLALSNYVKILAAKKRFQEAVKPVENYLDHFPTDKDMLVLQGRIYYDMGWYEVAIMKYNFITRDFPDAAEGYCGVAKCMYDLVRFKNASNYDQTIYALKQASEHDPDNPEPDLLAGTIYYDYKHYREFALEHFEKALSRSRNVKEQQIIRTKISIVKNNKE